MIAQRSIEAFLARHLDSHDWLKERNAGAVRRATTDLGYNPEQLWFHQQVSLLLMEQHPRFLLYLDPGGGKTKICLEFLKLKKAKAIVFVPFISAISTWLDEARKWAPGLKVVALLGSAEENQSIIEDNDADLVVGCYQSIGAAVTDRAGREWVFNQSKANRIFMRYQALILDEVHKCSNQKTITFQMCKAIARRVKYCYGLTGTPFSTDLQALWPQYYLIDFGHALGRSLSFYRAVYFNTKVNHWGRYEHTFKKRLMPELHRALKHRSIRFGIKEFADLPPKQLIKKHILMPEGAEQHIKKAREELNQAVIDKSYEVAGNSYLRLCQLSSGFLTFKDDEERIQVRLEDNPKLEALIEIISSLPLNTKIVVFHNFIYSNLMIAQALEKLKIKCARIWGGQRDPIRELKRFKEDPSCTVLVINTRSGSSALNLQFAQYMVFFEQPWTPADRTQAEARVWRPGQDKKVIIYDLFTRGCLDEQRFKSNAEGRDLLEDLLSGKQEV